MGDAAQQCAQLVSRHLQRERQAIRGGRRRQRLEPRALARHAHAGDQEPRRRLGAVGVRVAGLSGALADACRVRQTAGTPCRKPMPRRRIRPPCGALAAIALLAGLLQTSAASAQTPFVIDEWKFGRRQEASTLHYCVDARDPDLPVARRIGSAIASALLLQGREHVIGENVVGESIDSLYRVFLESCDVYLGFKLIPDAYPEWMKVTRPYYRASYLLAATNAGWRSLADVPKTQAIGSTMGTSADLRLIQY